MKKIMTSILLLSATCSFSNALAQTAPQPSSLYQYQDTSHTNFNNWYSTEGGYEGFSQNLTTKASASRLIQAVWVNVSNNYDYCSQHNDCQGVVFLYYDINNIPYDRIELVPTNWDIQIKQPTSWSDCGAYNPSSSSPIIEPGHGSDPSTDRYVCVCKGPSCQW